jgi:hypothetical protein
LSARNSQLRFERQEFEKSGRTVARFVVSDKGPRGALHRELLYTPETGSERLQAQYEEAARHAAAAFDMRTAIEGLLLELELRQAVTITPGTRRHIDLLRALAKARGTGSTRHRWPSRSGRSRSRSRSRRTCSPARCAAIRSRAP